MGDYHTGKGFSYALWTPGSELQLCRVPWDATYKDVAEFADNAALDTYLNQHSYGGSIKLSASMPVYPGRPIRVPMPLSDCYKYNYLRVYNPGLPGTWPQGYVDPETVDPPREFYYFINDCQFIGRDTTELYVQLDVWQTFRRTVTFNRAYVEQGHVLMAESNDLLHQGRVLLTQPEGFDIGGEYVISNVEEYSIVDSSARNYKVLIMSTVDIFASAGSTDSATITMASGTVFGGMPNGCNLYYFDSGADFVRAMGEWKDKPWITESILAINIVPQIAQNYDVVNGTVNGVTCHQLISDVPSSVDFATVQNFRDGISNSFNGMVFNKLRTYPYSIVEVTTNTATPLVLKPELVYGNDIDIVELFHVAPPDARIIFWIKAYNSLTPIQYGFPEGSGVRMDNGEYLDLTTSISNFPSMPIPNNQYLNYLARNRNTIAYGYSSADWSQQKALQGNQVSYDQSSNAMNAAIQSNVVSQGQLNAQTALTNQANAQRLGTGAAQSILGGFANGGVAGALAGAVGAGFSGINYEIGANQANQSAAINNAASGAQTNISNQVAAYNRDTNKSLADWSARGDYANAIAGINAKIQDAKMIQPTTSGQLGGEASLVGTVGWSVVVKVKTIDPSAKARVCSYWARYGYSVDRFIPLPPSLLVMTNFAYWRCKEIYLTSSMCPEYYKQTLRGIMEKGVTLWKNPDNIGNISIFDNAPVRNVYIPLEQLT